MHEYGESSTDLMLWLIYTHLFSKIPYSLGVVLRGFLLKRLLKRMGKGVTISTGVAVLYPKGIELGEYVRIARDCDLDGRGGLIIGNYTLIGFESLLITCTHNHRNYNLPIQRQGMFSLPIKIKDDVWVGARVSILPGITINEKAVLGINAIITKDVPAGSIVAGIPGKIVGRRGS